MPALNSMLGLVGIQHGRLLSDGASSASMHGRSAALVGTEERDQLPLVEVPLESRRCQEAVMRGETWRYERGIRVDGDIGTYLGL